MYLPLTFSGKEVLLTNYRLTHKKTRGLSDIYNGVSKGNVDHGSNDVFKSEPATARPAWDVWEKPTLPEDLYWAEGV